MVDKESHKLALVAPQNQGSTEIERFAAAVILKTYEIWMLRTFVSVPSKEGIVTSKTELLSCDIGTKEYLFN